MKNQLNLVLEALGKWEATFELPVLREDLEREWKTTVEFMAHDLSHRTEIVESLTKSYLPGLIRKSADALTARLRQTVENELRQAYRLWQTANFADLGGLVSSISEIDNFVGTILKQDVATNFGPTYRGLGGIILDFQKGLIDLAKEVCPDLYLVIQGIVDDCVAQFDRSFAAVMEKHLSMKEGWQCYERACKEFSENLARRVEECCRVPIPPAMAEIILRSQQEKIHAAWQEYFSNACQGLSHSFAKFVEGNLRALQDKSLRLFDPQVLSQPIRESIAMTLLQTRSKTSQDTMELSSRFFALLEVSEASMMNISIEIDAAADAWLSSTDTTSRFFSVLCVIVVFSGVPIADQPAAQYTGVRREWLRQWLHLIFQWKYEQHTPFHFNQNEFQWVLAVEQQLCSLVEAQEGEWCRDSTLLPDIEEFQNRSKVMTYMWEAAGYQVSPPISTTRCVHDTKSLHVTIGVPGWLSESEDLIQYWAPLAAWPGQGRTFGIQWKAGSYWSYLTQTLPGTVVNAVVSIYYYQMILYWAYTSFKSNHFNESTERAKATGIRLAQLIRDGYFGKGTVTLIGFSLGTRVIHHCLRTLNESRSKQIHDVILLGGAIGTEDLEGWKYCRRVVAGRLVNVYSKRDSALSSFYSWSQWEKPIGISKLKVEGVENFDVTDLVSGHLSYHEAMKDVLQRIGYNL